MAENVGGIYYDVTLDTAQMVRGERNVTGSLDRMEARFSAITAAVKVFAAAMALVKAAQLADDMRLLGARVEVAAGSMEKAAAAMSSLVDISTRTQTSVAANAQVFQRLNQSLLQMGGTQQDTLQLTELLAKAIKVSGASAQESSAAMLQFGQALGSGKLAGDELRSLMETAPYLMRKLADGIGVPVGALKQLGEEGKLTADVVVEAMRKAAEQIDTDFSKVPQTLSGGLQVVQDALGRLGLEMDNASGKSAVMTGAVKGLGEVIDQLGKQLAEANGKTDEFGRNNAVERWASRTREALSYVVDAFDALRQKITGTLGVASAIAERVGAPIDSLAGKISKMFGTETNGPDVKAAEDKGKLLGQRMREAWARAAVEDRGFTPVLPGSKLTPPKVDEKKGKGPAKFDAEGYLAGLEKQTVDGFERINLIEQEALRKNGELLKEKKITAEQAEKAITLIQLNAVQERRDLAFKNAEELRSWIEKQGKEEAAAAKKAADERARAQDFARGVLAAGDPILALQQELEKKSALLAEYAAKDQENLALYAEARVALERDTQARIAEVVRKQQSEQLASQAMVFQAYGSIFSSLADVTKTFGQEQSATFRALFAISKAFAIADSIIKIQQGIANAIALPFPANLAAAATVASSAAGIVSTIAGTSFGGGRQYGGPVAAGTLYRVNETGAPEMFTAANGSQFMLPTTNGQVTSAADLARGSGGGGTTMQVSQSFHFSGPVDRRSQQEIAAAASRGLQQAAGRYN